MYHKIWAIQDAEWHLYQGAFSVTYAEDLQHSLKIFAAYQHAIGILIMVIELSGVQFGLKSYALWFRSKIAQNDVQLPLYYIHFEIAQFNSLKKKLKDLVSTIIYWASSHFVKKQNQKFVYISFWKHVSIMSTWCDCVMWLVVLFCCLVLISWEEDAI